MDDLGANKFSALARVLNLPSSKRDFKLLLSPLNLQVIFLKLDDFVVLSVPCLHFEGPRNARVIERVLSRLLSYIVAMVETREFGQAENMAVGDDYPIPPLLHRNLQERRKRMRDLISMPSLSPFGTLGSPRSCPS